MQQPNTKNMQALQRLVREVRDAWTCSQTATGQGVRRPDGRLLSSSVMLGGHLLAASATTQNVVATSSGEAEFYTLTKSASRALGAVAMAAEMAKVVKTTCSCGRHSVEGGCLKARTQR